MKQHLVVSSCAAFLAVSVVAAAGQIPNRPPSQAPVTKGSSTTGEQGAAPTAGRTETVTQITVAGCVVREAAATGEKGGVLNTGAGAGNEFVLEKAAAPNATSGSATGRPTGTSYSLTGTREKELASLVGQRVEIVGTLEGTRNGMRELGIESFKAAGRCQD